MGNGNSNEKKEVQANYRASPNESAVGRKYSHLKVVNLNFSFKAILNDLTLFFFTFF
jgi:hypothetical protein